MKNRKGFIQIPLLIAIIAGVLVLSGVGYFGIKQYKNTEIENQQSKQQAEEQQKALEQAQAEIEKLKQESEMTKTKQQQLEQRVANEGQKSKTQDLSISASELEPYLTGVGEINCFGTEQKSGSASLWSLGGTTGYVALTNQHVVSGSSNCNLTIGDSSTDSRHSGIYRLDKTQTYSWNADTDISVLRIVTLAGAADISTPIQNLNYKISSLRQCPARMQLGSPVVVIGFPAFSQKSVVVEGTISSQSSRTITNGIISAHDTSVEKPIGNLLYPNYYVSSKIDSGNSGGVTLSKDNNGLCLLGVATWLSLGNFETQGVVQNIHNVKFRQ